jgi:hypothetical protein
VRIHLMDGYVDIGAKVSAVCRCGERTTPRVSDARALDALLSEHGTTAPVCALCGADYHGQNWQQLRDQDLAVHTDPGTGDEFFACKGMPQSCVDGARQRQVHLDRTAADQLGVELPRPQLRLVERGQDGTATRPSATGGQS